MKLAIILLCILLFDVSVGIQTYNNTIYFRFNQVGFLPDDIKSAVLLSDVPIESKFFYIKKRYSNNTIYKGELPLHYTSYNQFNYSAEIDFTELQNDGEYYIEAAGQKSNPFKIGKKLFSDVRDSLSIFFKVQRCGPTDPFLHQPCHLSDVSKIIGYKDSSAADLTGGWHDASDYIKFFSTAAYTTYLLLFSYEFDPDKFGYDLDKDGVPDILQEARVGIDWLLRCYIADGLFVTQVQDTSDHHELWRLPENDYLTFDRTGYTGKGKNLAGIFAAVMSLASRIWSEKFHDYQFAKKMLNTAIDVYGIHQSMPDVDSVQSGFYQDYDPFGKLALGSVELYITTKDKKYLNDAFAFADSAKSDFWWSWGNINSLAHYKISTFDDKYSDYIKMNLEFFNSNAVKSVFHEATDFTWGTTNSFLGAALQVILFRRLTEKNDYDSLLTFQRDYILGRNPWGVSFIFNIGYNYTKNFHSQVGYFNDGYLPGALSAGPAHLKILEKYKQKLEIDSLSKFNSTTIVFADDRLNFITNEPAIGSNVTALFVFGCLSDL